VDLEEGADFISAFPYKPKSKLLMVASDGRGFVVPTEEITANTRKGKLILNLDAPAQAVVCAEAEGDHVAIIGENRKLLIFPLKQVPEMTRGKGVRLGPHLDRGEGGPEGLARQPRRSRPSAAQGLPQEQPVRGVKASSLIIKAITGPISVMALSRAREI
jgi:hypothetical protein